MKKILITIGCTMAAPLAFAQTTFIGGPTDDIALVGNWDNGLPAIGNVGTLNSGAEWTSANTTLTDFYLDIGASGDLTRTIFFTTHTISGGVWNINGGSINNTTVVTLSGDAQVTMNSGDITLGSGRDLNLNGTSVLTVNGGTLFVGDEINVSGGTFTMNGGTTTLAGSAIVGDNFGANGTFNFNGGSFTAIAYGANNGSIGVRTLNFGGSTAGTVDFTGDFEALNTTLNWSSGSDMVFTVTGSLLDAGVATDYATLYSEGQILFEGSNAAPFANVFDVSGGSLSLVPEPSSFALLSGLLVIGVAVTRRRK